MSLELTKSIPEKYVTDASPSWNGYNHQGKVGLYIVLSMINNLQLKFDLCEEYELELEWLEDFCIKRNGSYISIHQVKTYNKTALSEYKDSIWNILAKLIDLPNDTNGYLHSTSQINNIKNIKTKLIEYVPPIEKSKKDNEDDTRKEITTKAYWTPKQCHDYVKESDRYDEIINRFSVYQYEDGCHHCNMDDIEGKITNQLKIFNKVSTPEQLERTYMRLLGLVDKHIRERHIDIQAKKRDQKVSINFQHVFNLINKNYEIPSKEYVIYKLRDRFCRLTTDFVNDLHASEELGFTAVSNKNNLYSIIEKVQGLTDKEFFSFCMKITPNYKVDEDNQESLLDALSNYILDTHMQDGFLEILKEVRKEIDAEKYTFIKRNSENKNISYLPTTIIDSYQPPKIERLVDNILNNSVLIDETLHEVDVMITKHITLHELNDAKIYNNVPEIEENAENDLEESILDGSSKSYNRITKIKKIRMIKIEDAKGEIDE